jgi:hypothetical protein
VQWTAPKAPVAATQASAQLFSGAKTFSTSSVGVTGSFFSPFEGWRKYTSSIRFLTAYLSFSTYFGAIRMKAITTEIKAETIPVLGAEFLFIDIWRVFRIFCN